MFISDMVLKYMKSLYAEYAAPVLNKTDRTVGWLIRALNAQLYYDLNPFDELNTGRIIFSTYGVVHPDYGQMGIVTRAAVLGIQLGASRGAGGVMAVASGLYSKKSMGNSGMRILRSLSYASFEMPDGARPLAQVDMGEHRTRYLFACNLQPVGEFSSKL